MLARIPFTHKPNLAQAIFNSSHCKEDEADFNEPLESDSERFGTAKGWGLAELRLPPGAWPPKKQCQKYI